MKQIWCHACKHEVFQSPQLITCGMCDSELIEEIESNSPHPRAFQPEGLNHFNTENIFHSTFTTHFIHILFNTPNQESLGATDEQINSLESIEDSNKECTICQDIVNKGKRMPCGHDFHDECILKWLKMKNSCPTCRTNA